MAIDRRKQFTKQPAEEYPIDMNFGSVVPLGANFIVSATASAVKWPRREPTLKTDATSEILLSNIPIVVGASQVKARIQVQGGIHDYEYQITVRSHWDNGAVLEEEIYMRVREE